MGSSDLAIPDFWSLTCGSCIRWDPHVSDSKSGKVRIGKLEDPAPLGAGCSFDSFTYQRKRERTGSATWEGSGGVHATATHNASDGNLGPVQ
jgi:hypothetical protein